MMNRLKGCWPLFAGLVLVCFNIKAGYAELGAASKKLATEDAPTVGNGVLEMNLGYTFSRATSSWGKDWETLHREELGEHWIEPAMTFGFTQDLDAWLSVGYADLRDLDSRPDNGGGVTNLDFGLKWGVIQDDERGLYLSWLNGFTAPTGRYETESHLGPGDRFWSYNTGLVLTKGFLERWVLDLETFGSLAFGEHRENDRGSLGVNTAVGYALFDYIQPEIELNYEHGFMRKDHDSDVLAVTAGVICPIEKWNLIVGLGAQQGIAGRCEDKKTSALLTVTYSFQTNIL